MSMFRAVEASGSGLNVQRARMDVIAENIANAETTRTPEGGPYRRMRVVVAAGEDGQPAAQVVGLTPDTAPLKTVHDPSHPDANDDGYVQLPNVDVSTEMVDMIAASRAYEANAKALSMGRAMMRDAIDILT